MAVLLGVSKDICEIAFDPSKRTVSAAAKSILGPSLAANDQAMARPARTAPTITLVYYVPQQLSRPAYSSNRQCLS